MDKEAKGLFRRTRAKICENCPMCRHGRAKPESIIGRILHHRYHADHCPMWNAHKELYETNGEQPQEYVSEVIGA